MFSNRLPSHFDQLRLPLVGICGNRVGFQPVTAIYSTMMETDVRPSFDPSKVRAPLSCSQLREGVARLCGLQQMIQQGIAQEPMDLAVKFFGVLETLQHNGQVVVALTIALRASLAK